MELIISLVSITVLVAVLSFSYAYIRKDTKEAGYNLVGMNCIEIKLEDVSGEINLKNAYPVTDVIGKTSKPYQFSLTNKCETDVSYQVNLEVFNESNINTNNIAVLFDENENKHVLGDNDTAEKIEADDSSLIKGSHKVGEGKIRPYETVFHKIRIWLNEDAGNDTQYGTFKSRIAISAVQDIFVKYTEPLLNGADPVITGDLVAVKIDEAGKVTKADPTQKWYEYGNKEWANAVILNESGKKKTFAYGEEISENDIESYFVWIPKYRYKLFDEQLGKYETAQSSVTDKGSTTAIEIKFGLENTTNSIDECITPMNENRTQGLSGESGSCAMNKWMTHPAFISFDTNGLWVGKFETSNNSGIQIKPNKTSWRYTTIGNSFNESKSYKEDLVSHLIKNTEWGAMAYLTQSIYGRCSKGNSTTCSEVTQNKNASYLTGYNTTTAYPDSKNASTTGNNTGIFDMNGGAWEYMASVQYKNNNKDIDFGLSGLTVNTLNDKKYYDVYNYGTNFAQYERRILGDATGELGPFQTVSIGQDIFYTSSYFKNYAFNINASNKYWFLRSGYNIHQWGAGIFTFSSGPGGSDEQISFRVVLAPR